MCCEVVRVFCICPCASGAETDVRESVLLCSVSGAEGGPD